MRFRLLAFIFGEPSPEFARDVRNFLRGLDLFLCPLALNTVLCWPVPLWWFAFLTGAVAAWGILFWVIMIVFWVRRPR